MVCFRGTETSPSSGASSPVIIRNSVVLPDPLGPTRPIFSPGLSWNEASTKRTCLPYCLLTLEREITAPSLYFGAESSVASPAAPNQLTGSQSHRVLIVSSSRLAFPVENERHRRRVRHLDRVVQQKPLTITRHDVLRCEGLIHPGRKHRHRGAEAN